jgi:nitrate/nitrite-specific signal transduction histidine kinase
LTYRQIKWLILIIPTLTIGIWEYVRHEFLLPYISMELGNWLAPVFVLLVTLLFLTQLFTMIEHNQEELNKAKALQAVLEEREKIAQGLHDGIAQSLFFLNTQLTQMERMPQQDVVPLQKLKESVHRTNEYVRQAIANLRHPADAGSMTPWLQGVESLIAELRDETDLQFDTSWAIPESHLSSKEKVELLAIVRESLLNVHKHADAKLVRIQAALSYDGGWLCRVVDDGKGFVPEEAAGDNRYGLKMMHDRARMMGWELSINRENDETIVAIHKSGSF